MERALEVDMNGNECRMPPDMYGCWPRVARMQCTPDREVFRPVLAAGEEGVRIGRRLRGCRDGTISRAAWSHGDGVNPLLDDLES